MTKTNFIAAPAYQAPVCEMVVLGTEGVLCASIFDNSTEDGSYTEGIFD